MKKRLFSSLLGTFFLFVLSISSAGAILMTKDAVQSVDLKIGVKIKVCKVDIKESTALIEPSRGADEQMTFLDGVFSGLEDKPCVGEPEGAILAQVQYKFRNVQETFDEFVMIFRDDIYRFDSPAVLTTQEGGDASSEAESITNADFNIYKTMYKMGSETPILGEKTDKSGLVVATNALSEKEPKLIVVYKGEAYRVKMVEEVLEGANLIDYPEKLESDGKSVNEDINSFPVFKGRNATSLIGTENTPTCEHEWDKGTPFDCETKVYTWQTVASFSDVWHFYEENLKKAGWVCNLGSFEQYAVKNSQSTLCNKGSLSYRLEMDADRALVILRLSVPNQTSDEIYAEKNKQLAGKSMSLVDKIAMYPGAKFVDEVKHPVCNNDPADDDKEDPYCSRSVKTWETGDGFDKVKAYFDTYKFDPALGCKQSDGGDQYFQSWACYPESLDLWIHLSDRMDYPEKADKRLIRFAVGIHGTSTPSN